jgi:hypothetical protein
MSNLENIVEVVEESLAEVPESLEAPKKKARGRPKALVVETDLPIEPVDESPPKKKRVQTEAQKANFQKALEKRKQNIELRKAAKLAADEAKEQEQLEKKVKLEKVIIKKAVCLKKKELLSQACLEDLSDCDVPDEVIQKVIKKQKAKKVSVPKPVAPVESPKAKYTFV